MANRSDVHRIPPSHERVEPQRALFALAAAPLLAGAVGLLAPATALLLGGACAAGATLDTLLRLSVGRRERARADTLILAGEPLPRDLTWRAEELSGERERTRLAKSLRSLLHSLDREIVMTAQVVNRPAARANRAELAALADRLERLGSPVAPLGIVRARTLLTDGRSPLFDPTLAADLPDHIRRVLRDLEPQA